MRVLIMAALDIALEKVKQTDNAGSAEVLRKVNELSRLIDSTLQENK